MTAGVLADGLRMAVGTLTALPVPAPSRVDRRVAGAAMLLAPIAGVLLGLGAGAVLVAGDAAGLPAPVIAALAVAALALGSRGLHVDGLSDTVDGLAASYDRDRAWGVMRRGDVGPAGAAALVLVLLVQVGAIAAVLDAGQGRAGAAAVVVAVVGSRSMLPLICVRGVPAARPDGLGAAVAGTVPGGAAAACALAVLAGAAVLSGATGLAPAHGVVAVVTGWAAAGLLVRRCVRRLGGVSGDVLGAAVEVAAAGCLVVFSAGGAP